MIPFQSIKEVPRVRAIGIRGDISLWNINTIFSRLYQASMRGKLLFREPALGIRKGELRVPDAFHSDYMVLFPLTEDPRELPPGSEIIEIPGARVASFLHRGSYERIRFTYEKVLDWLRDNPFEIAGDVREVFLVAPEPHGAGSQDDNLTEIQVPIVERRP
jgi:effector-binding domain-containing protein